MGAVFGGLLADSGNDVTLIDVWGDHVDAIVRSGLRIETAEGERVVQVPATTDPRNIDPVELVLVFVKSIDTRSAVEAARTLVGESTAVLTLQNGLGNREAIASVVGDQRALLGVTFDSAVLVGPGHVRRANAGATAIGEVDGSSSTRVRQIVETFAAAGIEAHETDNVLRDAWGKLFINCVFNATCAVTGFLSGQVGEFTSSREWARLVAEETAAVIRAQGLELPYDDPIAKIWQVSEAAGSAKASMLQDIEKGRWTEVDFINGAVVRAGLEHGVPTPYNRALQLLVQMVETRQHGEERDRE